ncbi:MAG: aminotransferase class III-fold pyridoxal phosphate-dependent enzyme [Myxococcota bacterium]
MPACLRALPLDEGEALAVLKDEDDLAAVVIEPIQSEGGEHFFSTPFLQSLRGLCSDRGTLLIFDEIETGFGSTGAWWDWQHHDVLPDLMCFGGKARIAGVAAVPSLDAVGAPFEGAAVEAVRCDQLLQIIERDGLIGNAETMGRYLLKLLRDLGETHEGIGNLRGQGLCAAMDLPDTQSRDRLVEACFEEQLVVSSSGSRSVRLRAPLDIDADSVARAVAQLEAGIRRAGRVR